MERNWWIEQWTMLWAAFVFMDEFRLMDRSVNFSYKHSTRQKYASVIHLIVSKDTRHRIENNRLGPTVSFFCFKSVSYFNMIDWLPTVVILAPKKNFRFKNVEQIKFVRHMLISQPFNYGKSSYAQSFRIRQCVQCQFNEIC